MLINILLLIIGFVLLSRGAEWLVNGASAIARRFHIPEIIIGLTIVACGTSAPEAAVSISSVIGGSAGVGIGNILGSNIANIFLILGVSALISNLYVQKNTILYEIPFVGFISVLLMFMGWQYGTVSRLGALILCALFVLFFAYLYVVAKRQKNDAPEIEDIPSWKMIAFVIAGIVLLIVGAKLTVNSAVNIARALSISERVIGLTIIAFGTSLPELVTCIVAAIKRHSDIVIGNIVGSNIFNILFVLGVTGLIQPIPFENAFILDSAFGIVATVLLFIFVFHDKKLTNNMKKIIFIFTVLYSINAFGYYTETIPNQCGAIPEMFAVFTLNQYTCNSGQFLPAYTLGCVSCPADYTCTGGTFAFNENKYQGAIKSSGNITHNLTNMCGTNAPHELFATFTPNQHTCSAGYYLPANIDECRPCLKDNKCIGGTYSFNETNDQGIEPCPNDKKYAPSHSAVCYPRRMHIDEGIYVYLKSTPSTDPALNVNVNGTMYHANLVRDEIPMNKDTDRFLPVTINGVQYFACDDTSCPQ